VLLAFLPMRPIQILLNNLLYDVSELAIPLDEVDPEQLERPTRWDLHFVRLFMTVFGTLSSLFDAATFGVLLLFFHAGEALFQTGWFMESLTTQVLSSSSSSAPAATRCAAGPRAGWWPARSGRWGWPTCCPSHPWGPGSAS